MTLYFRPAASRRSAAGATLTVAAVWCGDAYLGEVCEIAPWVWWWRLPGMPHFAPAPGGPQQRDCGDVLLRLRDGRTHRVSPPPPRRNIPTTAELIRLCRQPPPAAEEDA